MKKFRISTILMFLFLLGFVFTLSSKQDPFDFRDDGLPCSQENETRVIQIDFSQMSYGPNGFTRFRTNNFQGYLPPLDLRTTTNLNDSAGASLGDENKFYCLVTVTSPQCSTFSWTRVLDITNATSSGRMNIEILGGGADTHLKVEYYEAVSGPRNGNFMFNTLDNSRLKYTFEQEYFGGLNTGNNNTIPQPIFLNVTGLEGGPGFFWGVPPHEDKSAGMGDYSGINNYIDLNNLNL